MDEVFYYVVGAFVVVILLILIIWCFMSLFKCEKCGCVENTATGSYWGKEEKLCSECCTGKWHGIFDKRPAKGMYYDRDGFLYEVENDRTDSFRTIGVME